MKIFAAFFLAEGWSSFEDSNICKVCNLQGSRATWPASKMPRRQEPTSICTTTLNLIHSSLAKTNCSRNLKCSSTAMIKSLFRNLPALGRKWQPLVFSNTNFPRIPLDHLIEEETLPDYVASRYYPTRIGELIKERYQVVGKLGFGASSTVWLARDLRYEPLKMYVKTRSS